VPLRPRCCEGRIRPKPATRVRGRERGETREVLRGSALLWRRLINLFENLFESEIARGCKLTMPFAWTIHCLIHLYVGLNLMNIAQCCDQLVINGQPQLMAVRMLKSVAVQCGGPWLVARGPWTTGGTSNLNYIAVSHDVIHYYYN
jgi:hypothetical protein